MNKCIYCNVETKNPKFCSSSCAAKVNNLKPKKIKRLFKCVICKLVTENRRKYCKTCFANTFLVNEESLTLKDLQSKRKYQKHSRIRQFARNKAKAFLKQHNLALECTICHYDNHVEVCHIIPVSSFQETNTLAEINSLSNLTLLCPNHHWEFDNQILKPRGGIEPLDKFILPTL